MQIWCDYIKRCSDKWNIGGEGAAYELKSPFNDVALWLELQQVVQESNKMHVSCVDMLHTD